MFNLSTFVKKDYTQTPITNGDSAFEHYMNHYEILSTALVDNFGTLYGSTRFCNDGIHYRMQQFPVSDYALENLFYVQSFSYQEMGPKFFTHRKNTKSYQIIYTYEGCGELKYEGQTYILKPGDGVFLDCMKESSYRTVGDSWKHCVLHLNGRNAGYYYQLFAENGNHSFFQPLSGHFQELLDQTAHYMHLPTLFRDVDVSNTLENILMLIIRTGNNYLFNGVNVPDNIHKLVDYIYSHYTENITLDDLAEISGYNKYYMCRLFKKYFNMSPQSYLIQLRILLAKELLRDTDMPIQNICDIIGIDDSNYFYRLYKAKTGMSPAAYRKSIRSRV